MSAEPTRSPIPFLWSFGVLLVVSIAVARLPQTFVEQLRRNRALDGAQAGWAYRLLVLMAVLQAAYAGFVMLRADKVGAARSKDLKLARMSRGEVAGVVQRNAAGIPLLTLVYGLTAFVLTGERGGFWLFPLIVVLQLAWHFRQTGDIVAWLEFQPEFAAPRDEVITPSARPDPHRRASEGQEEPE